MPAVNRALAVNAAVALSPASSRNSVLMPQMNDAARVLNSMSTRYTRWTVRGCGFMVGRTYRGPSTFQATAGSRRTSAAGHAGPDLGAAQGRVGLGRLASPRQLGQQLGRGPGDGGDGLLERRLGGRGGAGDAADLADVLAGGGLDLLAGGGRLQAPQGGDVAAHASGPFQVLVPTSLPGRRDGRAGTYGLSRSVAPAKMQPSAVEGRCRSR